ncbi:hypothetical protein STEG23_029725 [Scotinomys teguina]
MRMRPTKVEQKAIGEGKLDRQECKHSPTGPLYVKESCGVSWASETRNHKPKCMLEKARGKILEDDIKFDREQKTKLTQNSSSSKCLQKLEVLDDENISRA